MEKNKANKIDQWFKEMSVSKNAGISFMIASVLPTALLVVVWIILAVAGVMQNPDFQQADWYRYIAYLCTPVAFFFTSLYFFSGTRLSLKDEFRCNNCSLKYYLMALLMQVGLFGLSELNSLFLSFLGQFGYTDAGIQLPSMDGFGFVGVLLVVAVLPALMEELFFRGVLLKGLKCFGETGAIFLCGALFSLFHQNPAQTVYQFCCGAAYALLAVRSGSILPTAFAHFLNNAVILILYKLGVQTIPMPVFIIIVCVAAVCLAAALVWIFAFDKKQKRLPLETDKTDRKNFLLGAGLGIVFCAFSWLTTLISGIIGG